MNGDQRRDQTVHQAFRHFVAVLQQDGRVGHQVADVTDKHQASTFQAQLTAVGCRVGAVSVHLAGQLLATFFKGFLQVTLHQAKPVAVSQCLVVSVYGRYRIFAVHDGGQSRLHQNVFDVSAVVFANRVAGVDLDFEVHAVLDQQHAGGRVGSTGVADKAGFVFQTGGLTILQLDDQLATFNQILGSIFMAARGQRRGAVEQVTGPFDNFGPANRVVTTAFVGAAFFGDRIGTVKGIVQATPARVRRVERKPGVHDRNHQLRAGHGGHLRIHIGGGDLEFGRLVNEITDVFQEGLVLGHVQLLTLVITVPAVHFFLDRITLGQQLAVAWRQLVHDLVEFCPEFIGIDPCARDRFIVHEIIQILCDLNAADLYAFCHRCLPQWVTFPDSPFILRGHSNLSAAL